MRSPLVFILIAASLLTTPVAGEESATPAGYESVNLQSRVGDLEVVRDGERLLIQHHDQTLTAEQYVALVEAQQQRRDAGGPLFKLFNITTAVGIAWVAVGLLGQLLFTGRMIVQWLASERDKRSVVPPIFWHISLAGATMLLVYFVWRKDIVGVLGQSAGWAIYARNLYLLRKARITVTRTGEVNDDES
ncbi:MAG: lipid-A-disaccharide synthase N-terminal domain-containing protein [Planctomycetota bacterium]